VTESLTRKVDARGVTVTATFPLRHLCPFKDEADEGRISIKWAVSKETFELHSLAEYLAEFADLKISHEELTTRIFRELGSMVVGIETTWSTAGAEVVVTRGGAL
jgi:NADPH-dependent 7-cyano-7-deazaguanine reductase QueF